MSTCLSPISSWTSHVGWRGKEDGGLIRKPRILTGHPRKYLLLLANGNFFDSSRGSNKLWNLQHFCTTGRRSFLDITKAGTNPSFPQPFLDNLKKCKTVRFCRLFLPPRLGQGLHF